MHSRHASRTNAAVEAPKLGGKFAAVLSVFTLLAFVTESQLTEYVQSTLGYRHPYFLLYVVHSTFSIIFPIHLLYLALRTGQRPRTFIASLANAARDQLSPKRTGDSSPLICYPFPSFQLIRLILLLTVGITWPSLLWFAAVSLTSISDVTALWNTNAFFAYVLSVKVFRLKWEPRKLAAVCGATLGAACVVYGGSKSSTESEMGRRSVAPKPQALMGDVFTVVASVGYGLYQVLYKKYAALPSDPEAEPEEGYSRLPVSHDDLADESLDQPSISENTVPSPPFGLYANMLTSCIGLCTLLTLWIPIPFLHYLHIEPFALPADLKTVSAIACMALSGLFFNASLMILIGVWGPIITSVGNLLTIVLVYISDILWGHGAETLTIWSLAGSSLIVIAFAVLMHDMLRTSAGE